MIDYEKVTNIVHAIAAVNYQRGSLYYKRRMINMLPIDLNSVSSEAQKAFLRETIRLMDVEDKQHMKNIFDLETKLTAPEVVLGPNLIVLEPFLTSTPSILSIFGK